MAEPARRTSVATKGPAEQASLEKSSANKASPNEGEAEVDAGEQRGHAVAWLVRHPSRGALLILLGLSLMLNGVVVWHFRGNREASPGSEGALEVDLGEFVYRASEPAEKPLQEARFTLSVALRDDIETVARKSLEDHRRRIRQAVEELLRRASDDDFGDPNLTGLKRRLREQINGVLGIRGIAEVVITELVTSRSPQSASSPEEATAYSAPPNGGSR